MALVFLVFGTIFGFVLSRSGAADYNYIQGMFLFERFQLYGIIGTAVVLTAPGLWLIKRAGRTASGARLDFPLKTLHRGTVVGGLLFGIGWSIAGMCPGPIFVNIGEGKVYALAALAGGLVGAGLFGSIYTRIQPIFRLPQLTFLLLIAFAGTTGNASTQSLVLTFRGQRLIRVRLSDFGQYGYQRDDPRPSSRGRDVRDRVPERRTHAGPYRTTSTAIVPAPSQS